MERHEAIAAAVMTLQRVLSVLWGRAFAGVFDGVMQVLGSDEHLLRDQPIAYLAYRLEGAMGSFQMIGFDPQSTMEPVRRCSSEGCALILKELLGDAMDVENFEEYPHARFMRVGGIFEDRFALIKGVDGTALGKDAAAAAGEDAAMGEPQERTRKQQEAQLGECVSGTRPRSWAFPRTIALASRTVGFCIRWSSTRNKRPRWWRTLTA